MRPPAKVQTISLETPAFQTAPAGLSKGTQPEGNMPHRPSPTALALVAILCLVTACAGARTSRLNPLNWFGPGRAAPATELVAAEAEDPRALVAQVTKLVVEPTPGGAIVRATGLPPTQGYWEAELVEVETEDPETLTFDFRIFPPLTANRAGTPISREVVVAIDVSNIALAEVSRITVQGATNALTSGR
jgi:hypothetical protein